MLNKFRTFITHPVIKEYKKFEGTKAIISDLNHFKQEGKHFFPQWEQSTVQ